MTEDQLEQETLPSAMRWLHRAPTAPAMCATKAVWCGTGKNITMTCFAAWVMQEPAMANPTIVVITDRSLSVNTARSADNMTSRLRNNLCQRTPHTPHRRQNSKLFWHPALDVYAPTATVCVTNRAINRRQTARYGTPYDTPCATHRQQAGTCGRRNLTPGVASC